MGAIYKCPTTLTLIICVAESSTVRQAVSGNVHSKFSDTHSVDNTTFVSRVPLQSCANTHYDESLGFSSPEVPVLSNLAQHCLRSGLKPKGTTALCSFELK